MAVFVWRCQQDVVFLQVSMNNPIPAWLARARMRFVGSMSTVTQSISNAVEHMPYKGFGKNQAIGAVSKSIMDREFLMGFDTFFVDTSAQAPISSQTRHIRSRCERFRG